MTATAYEFWTMTAMKEYLISTSREWISPSMRYEVAKASSWLREQLNRACLWNWKIDRFSLTASTQHEIVYIGRETQRDAAISLLSDCLNKNIRPTTSGRSDCKVIISEVPFPGSLSVPSMLNSVIPLGRSIEEITSNYHNQLRRELQKNRSRYSIRQVRDSAEIEHVDREMLRPYAIARHGKGASQIELNEVIRMAQEYGRLDLLLFDGKVVGCQLGHNISRDGLRYWSTNRCGYPYEIFSDPKRLRVANSFNIYLALEWAIENSYDFYDIGVSLGRPGDGLLEWKRRRGGELNTLGNSRRFHILLPERDKSVFLWDAPLFSIEDEKVTLHLGLPCDVSDEDFKSRYREMGFGGLSKIYLYHSKAPGKQLLETLHSYYAHQKLPPILKLIRT